MSHLMVSPGQIPGQDLSRALERAALRLSSAGISSARVDAELLAAFLLDVDANGRQHTEYGYSIVTRSDVQREAMLGKRLTPRQVERFEQLVERRAQRVPLQHITGIAPFHRIEVKVGPGVFVPRPETELLVEAALEDLSSYPEDYRPRVVDLCTGSGAIAAAIKTAFPRAQVQAVELSPAAAAWARKNLEPRGVYVTQADARDVFADAPGYFDVVVSNPPYIPAGNVPQDPEVAEHDPAMALYGGGTDGMELPTGIISHARYLLKPGGFFVMEHDESQAEAVAAVMRRYNFEHVRLIRDLAGRPRHTAAHKPQG